MFAAPREGPKGTPGGRRLAHTGVQRRRAKDIEVPRLEHGEHSSICVFVTPFH